MSHAAANLMCPRCCSVLPPRLLAAICPRCLFLDEPDELAPGTVVAGHAIGAVLGRGGMSTVYRARHAQLNRDVALKVLQADSPDFAARFEREAKALARLDDETIVRIYEYGQHDGLAFIAMQLVEGESLRAALVRGPMSVEQARPIVAAVCRALATAHERGVIHRDIKPENVLLAADGSVKVADFGIAQLLGGDDDLERLTQTGALVGTPHYIAPERLIAARPVDARSDLYSVGVLLYEMLTGRVPIGPLDLPGTPLDHVLRRCLQHDPARRYESAAALAADLQANRGTLDYSELLWELGVALLITAACVTGCLAGIRYVAVLAEDQRSLTPLEYVAYLPFGAIVLAVLLSGLALASYAALVRYWSRAGLLAGPRAGLAPAGWLVLGLGAFVNLLWGVRVVTGAEWMYRYAALYGGMLMVLALLAAVLTQMNARRTGRGPLRQWPVWLGLAATVLPASCEAVLQLW